MSQMPHGGHRQEQKIKCESSGAEASWQYGQKEASV